MKTFARALALLALLVPPLLSYAYPPPCQRGDLYVGGSSVSEAQCVERRYMKLEKALKRGQSGIVQRRLAPPATRRTQSETVRKVYLHPVTSRGERAGLVKERNALLREHSVRIQEIEYSLRPSRGERGKSPAALRKDRRPAAKVTPRLKHMRQKRKHIDNKATRVHERELMKMHAEPQ